MLAVRYVKSVPRWLLLKALGRRFRGLCTSRLSPVELADVPEPKLPGPNWVRVRPRLSGICGSDLASITAEGSPFFAPLTSFPFVFGHEVVGTITEVGDAVRGARVGDRVVIEPVLHCGVRGIGEPCVACREGRTGNCTNVAAGGLSAGVQTGYCRDTGGGWSPSLVAHELQLHAVPEEMADEAAVLAEPFSCALHGVLRALPEGKNGHILVIGCGTMGLLTIASLRALDVPCRIVALAKHSHQQELAHTLGADELIAPGRGAYEQLCKLTGATLHYPELGRPTVLGGFDVVFDCVGSPRSVDDALRFTRARGRTLLVGMPSIPKTVDWTTIWYKELEVRGTYTYGMEDVAGERLRTFTLALRLLARGRPDLRPLVTHRFPLPQYRDAIRTALDTGRSGSIKTVFDLTGGPP
ncbi:MAG TPA: alcohol dehydrogenase catalytic domain-containing protein [Gemmataceae bacterium]|nr:alcohol dehydrogenase catalytic domain-containing protein [Gemmataceae bacterium]